MTADKKAGDTRGVASPRVTARTMLIRPDAAVQYGYSPLNSGFRFCANAVIPSIMSLVEKSFTSSSRSIFRCCSGEMPGLIEVIFKSAFTQIGGLAASSLAKARASSMSFPSSHTRSTRPIRSASAASI